MAIAWIFPGQGSQVVGMGRQLHETSAAARAIYQQADDALGYSISKLCFEGPLEELTLTANTQPALVTTSIALVAALREAAPDLAPPTVSLGHSLGEWSALVAAGVLSFADAVKLVHERGSAMQRAVPAGEGGMAAIMGTDDAVIAELCQQAGGSSEVAPANFNAPGQTVIAGKAAAVAEVSRLVAERGGKAIALKVSAPFHSALMKPAAVSVAERLAPIQVGAYAFPVIANVDAEPGSDPAQVKDLLVRQVDAPVQWVRSVQRAVAMGVDTMLEIGPGKVLAGLVKRIDKSVRVLSVADAASLEATLKELA